MGTLRYGHVSTTNGFTAPPVPAEPDADETRTGRSSSSTTIISSRGRCGTRSCSSIGSRSGGSGATVMPLCLFRRSTFVGALALLFFLAAITNNLFWANLGQKSDDRRGPSGGGGCDDGDKHAGAAADDALGQLVQPREEVIFSTALR